MVLGDGSRVLHYFRPVVEKGGDVPVGHVVEKPLVPMHEAQVCDDGWAHDTSAACFLRLNYFCWVGFLLARHNRLTVDVVVRSQPSSSLLVLLVFFFIRDEEK